jgi:hypothetical protein
LAAADTGVAVEVIGKSFAKAALAVNGSLPVDPDQRNVRRGAIMGIDANAQHGVRN